MADKKLNEVTPKTDVTYILGTLNDGSTVRISKEDLAKVVGGLAANDDNLFKNRGSIDTKADFNDIRLPGFYSMTDIASCLNAPPFGYGICLVFNKPRYCEQVAFTMDPSLNGKIALRNCAATDDETKWGEWKQVTLGA